jgi:hypothetical protein
VSLYETLKNLPFLPVTNGSFQKVGECECQPDLAFYLRQVQVSLVLPELAIARIEEALRRSQIEEDGAVNRWLLKQFQEAN